MNIFDWHIKKYPLMEKQDLHKLIFQSQFGNSHLINNVENVEKFLYEELSILDKSDEDLYEYVGQYVRVNLRPFIKYNLNINYLLKSFIQTSNNSYSINNEYNNLLEYYNLNNNQFSLSHSNTYRENYKPAYRLIYKSFLTDELRNTQVFNFINNIKKPVIISIEGKCASGKTTLSNIIKEKFKATIIHMDDFFLPISRKSKDRLDEVGGNINYELVRETIINIRKNNCTNYKVFDCTKQEYYEKDFAYSDIIILEGVYSYHKYFRDLIDKLIFINTDYNTRIERLKERNNFDRFINEWIPLEDKYFELENILFLSDLIV